MRHRKGLTFFISFLGGLHATGCHPKQKQAHSSQALGSRASSARSVVAEDISVLFPLDESSLEKAATDEAAIEAAGRAFVPLSALFDETTYASILRLITGAGDKESNPLDSLGGQIRLIPLARWFIVSVRFEACGQSFPAPPSWREKVDPAVRGALCDTTIRLVAQPVGARTERGPDGEERRAGAIDDKALHVVSRFVPPELKGEERELAKARERFRSEWDGLIEKGAADGAAFAALASRVFSKDLSQKSLRIRQGLKRLVLTLTGEGTTARLRIPRSTGVSTDRVRAFLAADFVKTTQWSRIASAFSTTGAEPGSDNEWVFQNAQFKEDRGFQNEELRFAIVPKAEKVTGTASSGVRERFSDQPGEAGSFDFDLLTAIEKNQGALDYVLGQTALRLAWRQEDGRIAGEWEMGRESIPSDDYRAAIAPLLRGVDDPSAHSVATQPCVSCHVTDGFMQKQEFGQSAATRLDRNRVLDTPLITEQQSLTQTWNIRQFGYFGRWPTIGSRLIHETDAQVKEFNDIP